jgi:hypothetical protein
MDAVEWERDPILWGLDMEEYVKMGKVITRVWISSMVGAGSRMVTNVSRLS